MCTRKSGNPRAQQSTREGDGMGDDVLGWESAAEKKKKRRKELVIIIIKNEKWNTMKRIDEKRRL